MSVKSEAPTKINLASIGDEEYRATVSRLVLALGKSNLGIAFLEENQEIATVHKRNNGSYNAEGFEAAYPVALNPEELTQLTTEFPWLYNCLIAAEETTN